jgi:hypothetical protein
MLKFLIFFALLTFVVACQKERHIKTLFEKSNADRDKYFMELSKERKAYWFNKYVNEVGVDTMSGHIMEDVGNAIHFADLNHDTFPDIIDESNLGISPVIIYLTYQDSFRKIIDDSQSTLKEIRYTGNKTEIVTKRVGMIDHFKGETIYMLANDSIHLVKYRTRRSCTDSPQVYFKTPLSIQTLAPNTPLRENPVVAKGECYREKGDKEYHLSDNILERFKKHTHGLVWGETYDINGQKWWLVEILSVEYPEYCGYRVGWMKAADVEEID